MPIQQRRTTLYFVPQHKSRALLVLFLTLVILLPRMLALDHFVNNDEPRWLIRSGNFYLALTEGEFEKTAQREHPGVTIMWATTASYLWHYPTYVQDVPGYLEWDKEDIQPFLRAHGHEPLELLITARLFVILMITVALMLAFLVATRLVGWWLASIGFLLIALDPFHIALSRMLHLDGLLSSLMLLSVLAFLDYLTSQYWRGGLVLSGIAAGLAWLTKSPSFFLIPFMALLLLPELFKAGHTRPHRDDFWRVTRVFLAWCFVGGLTYVLLWPALWVNPIDTINEVLLQALNYATKGHYTQLYFNGMTFEGDAGFSFYPITYLWRTSPVVLFGLAFAFIAFISKQAPLNRKETRYTTVVLTLFAFLFLFFLLLSSKKLERYLIPAYLALDIVAALGWFAVAQLLMTRLPKHIASVMTLILLTTGVMGQAFVTLAVYPHFLSYYNPLLGGGSQAPQTMLIGWGEGLDEAARYLNEKPNADQLRVASWYHFGSVSFFSDAEVKPLTSLKDFSSWFDTDYVILYIQQWQRELPDTTLLAHFARQTPEKIIQINEMDYAQIYKVREILPPDWIAPGESRFTDWNEAIRLVAYELPTEPLALGDTFQTLFHLENMAPLEQDVSVLVRIVDSGGNELLRDEGWPWGTPTSKWKLYDIWPDGHDFTIPVDAAEGYYQVRLSFYDPTTLQPLPASDSYTGEPRGDELLVDYLYVGQLPTPPADSLPTELGSDIRLLGTEVRGLAEQAIILPSVANQTLEVLLFWQTEANDTLPLEAPITQELTVFVHFVGPDGQLVAQQDQPPPVPTDLWRMGDIIVGQTTLTVPPDAAAGSYELRVGMYDSATGQRLPVSENGQMLGDYISIANFDIK